MGGRFTGQVTSPENLTKGVESKMMFGVLKGVDFFVEFHVHVFFLGGGSIYVEWTWEIVSPVSVKVKRDLH